MPKKRGNKKKNSERKKTSLIDIERKINKMLTSQERIERLERKLYKEELETQELERDQLEEEGDIQALEKRQLKEMEELEELEKDIKHAVVKHPLRKITIRDFSKGLIGAFIGIVSHYAFIEGAHVAEDISIARASFLLVLSFLVGFVFIYFTGYRRVNDKKLLEFLPIRVLVIYLVSLFAIFVVLFAFGLIEPLKELDFGLIYRQVGVISLPAIIGAAAADLIGKNE